MGEVAGAQKALDALNAARDGIFVKPITRLSLSLSGALAAKRGDGPKAVADLERALSMLAPFYGTALDQHAVIFDLLAQAYAAADDLAKARETYEKITALITNDAWGATYARAFYHLGVIAEQQGDKARAREQFQKFLDLWKNADPGQREVADAKKRMGR
jgi:tetratricopeptide (TPR) repeat protein